MTMEDRVTLVEAVEDDAYMLADISKRAFESDAEISGGEPGGPPGYDKHKDQVRYMGYFDYYRIMLDDFTAGGVMVAFRGEGQRELVRMFVDPEHFRQGVGSRALELAMERYPDAKRWTLETPEWNTRTKAFYEKHGFTQVGWTSDSEGKSQRWYQRLLGTGQGFTDIAELRDGVRSVTVEGVIAEKGYARAVRSRRRYGETLSVADAGLEDETGRVVLTLWNEQIKLVAEGDRVRIENGYVGSYRGVLQLNVGMSGHLVKLI
ncbi:GNAT family N-acetyltransferase [Candidatus Bathyarchaeota archaeon]|nr:GNAT family N-acetyltransferase [Candidatus Bathyarchaeota archaeon]